jgi:hypothetical protein
MINFYPLDYLKTHLSFLWPLYAEFIGRRRTSVALGVGSLSVNLARLLRQLRRNSDIPPFDISAQIVILVSCRLLATDEENHVRA